MSMGNTEFLILDAALIVASLMLLLTSFRLEYARANLIEAKAARASRWMLAKKTAYNIGDSTKIEGLPGSIFCMMAGVYGLSGVTDVTLIMSDELHGFELVVTGGDSDEIATRILDRKIMGIATFGKIERNVNYLGLPYPIHFSRPDHNLLNLDWKIL